MSSFEQKLNYSFKPQTNEPQRQTLLNIIQRTLVKQSTLTANKVS
ncbi:hypothetical protein MC7420_1172 [Coleofasciculus chthonoplastes PCC 7420]|uniref:Uncharacterized protein n=1 Tax=Coleofasciculus chthonoplastes PCC 7420 TaxID=118168 RepID=B4VXM1_9CYAN|nr:hypothetical protein [Coleofasciculus chthonoplastes]EDX73376.1 hypothetical protein MC7420_1172 [Coleofasciculus chthonoplastes PCC 7420]